MTRRFHVGDGALDGDAIELTGALASRLAKVLRMRAGEEIVLFDGGGADVRVRLEDVNERRVTASVIERGESPAEPRVRVHLYQSITKGERFEWRKFRKCPGQTSWTEVKSRSFLPGMKASCVALSHAGSGGEI